MRHEQQEHERFRALFDAVYGPLLAYAIRRTENRADAEEVVADALLVAWRRRGEMPRGDALPWLYGVARRVLANQRRGQRRRQRVQRLLTVLRPGAADPAERVDAGERTRAVLSAMARLSETDREVLRLRFWEGLSHAEIGASLGCAENAAAIRLHRARRRLAEELLKEESASGQEAVEIAG